MTGASWFFVALARHAREHGGGELLRWDGEGEASDYLHARSRELGPRPDGLGVWAQDGTDIAFLLEYDTGTEHLPQFVGKLTGYAEQAGINTALTMPLLFCFPTARREQSARKALAATVASLDLQIATAALARASPARPAVRHGCPCTVATRRCGSSTWAAYSPTPGAPNPNTTSKTRTS